MLIILSLYVILLWLVFSRLKLVRWGWVSGTLAVLTGAFIFAAFLAMFNYLTPSGSSSINFMKVHQPGQPRLAYTGGE